MTPKVEVDILHIVTEIPGISTSRVLVQVPVAHLIVWRMLLEQQLYPYQCNLYRPSHYKIFYMNNVLPVILKIVW
jgi:hypothetical protein